MFKTCIFFNLTIDVLDEPISEPFTKEQTDALWDALATTASLSQGK